MDDVNAIIYYFLLKHWAVCAVAMVMSYTVIMFVDTSELTVPVSWLCSVVRITGWIAVGIKLHYVLGGGH